MKNYFKTIRHNLVKSLFLFAFVLSFFLFKVSFSHAQEDAYSLLEGMTIGQAVDESILSQGTLVPNADKSKYIYIFESGQYAHPHILYVTDNKISFIQLTIPFSLEQKYQDLLISYKDKGGLEMEKTETESMMGFPDAGIAFILNGKDGKVMRVQKYIPKTNKEFIKDEGKGYTLLPSPTPYDFSSPESTASVTQTLKNTTNSTKLLLIGLSTLILVLVAVLMIIINRKKKLPQVESKENNPQV